MSLKQAQTNWFDIAKRVAHHGVLIAFSLAFLLPLVWMFFISIRPTAGVYQNPITLDITFRPENYLEVWQSTDFATIVVNSFLVTIGTTFLIVIVTVLAGYSISWMKFKGQDTLLLLLMAGIFLPTVALIVPLFKISQMIGISNSLIGIMPVYAAVFSPIALLIFVGFFDDMPDSLLDAARLDGCSHFGFLRHICLPMSMSVVKAASLLVSVFIWNEFTIALVMLQDQGKMTIPLRLNLYSAEYTYDVTSLFVLLSLSIVPLLLVYVFLWRDIETGVSTGGI